ncbi:hypothetical protein BZA77DRAFT_368086 [Pyronema omphalodes]|nr:hypothetical protein BZA77DRAFT_368086 [Pyronema omphalodes]
MADSTSKLSFLEKFKGLFDSKDHSDISIQIGSKVFHAHHAILKLRTAFFEKATNKENGFAESISGIVEIKDHSAHAIWRFITYCYTGDYSNESNSVELGHDDDVGPFKHCRVHALADMLVAPDVKKLAAKKLDHYLTETWTQDSVVSYFVGFAREIYATTNACDEDIRSVLVKATRAHMIELIKHEDFKAVLFEIPEYSGALCLELHRNAHAKTANYYDWKK